MVETGCNFNFNECFSRKCSSFNLCALTSTERHITKIENQVGEIFQSLTLLSEVTQSNSKQIIDIKEKLNSVIKSTSEVKEELSNINGTLKENNKKIEQLADEISQLKSVFLSEKGNN